MKGLWHLCARVGGITAAGAMFSLGLPCVHASPGEQGAGALVRSGAPLPGFSFMYVASIDKSSSELSVFSNSGGHPIQDVENTSQVNRNYGANPIAYVATSSQACLVLAIIPGVPGAGSWESFIVDPSTGLIGAQVSTVVDKGGSGVNKYSGYPEDIVPGPTGTYVVGADGTNSIEKLNVGPGCTLGPISRAQGSPPGSQYFLVRLVGAHSAVAPNHPKNTVDTFSVDPYAFVSTAAATVPFLQGFAALGTTVATGSYLNGTRQVETGSSAAPNGITWGGIATDPGEDVFDLALSPGCLFGGGDGSNGLEWYTTSGSPPAPSFQGSTASPGGQLGPIVPIGSNVLMTSWDSREIYSSPIGANCALAPVPFANLNDNYDAPEGFAVH